MDFDHESVRLVVNEDRLSSLPDELIHQILSCIDDTKFVVQTCLLLSPRWKLLWKSVPRLSFSFSTRHFPTLPKFSKFVTNVLSRRNHQVEVSSAKLSFRGAASQPFVRKIANYAFSHNVQELTIRSSPKNQYEFPLCLFSSPSLKHLTFISFVYASCSTPKTPWNFPALTTLHLSEIKLCDDDRESLDLFSKCVNLKSLTLKSFIVEAKVVDIITPQLSSLVLIEGCRGNHSNIFNVIAPKLENLTIIDCWINQLNAPPGLSSFVYTGYDRPKWFKGPFRSLNKVSVCLSFNRSNMLYREEDARETISMLQELQNAKFLTLNFDIVECLSAFPDLLSHLPSPFSNLICLNIDPNMRKDAYKVNVSAKARNFLLENSPSATFIMDLPEEPPTKAMIAKQAREMKRAKLIADIESNMKELQTALEQQSMLPVERELTMEKAKLGVEKLMAELQELLIRKKLMQSGHGKAMESVEIDKLATRMMAKIIVYMEEINGLIEKDLDNVEVVSLKKVRVRSLLEAMPKRQKAEIEARHSHQLQETESMCNRLTSKYHDKCSYLQKTIDAFKEVRSDYSSTLQNISSSKIPLASQPSSSSAIPMPSTPQVSNLHIEAPTQGC